MNDMHERVKERIERENVLLDEMNAAGVGHGDEGDQKMSRFVIDCLQANAVGDGKLYAHMHKDKYVYNASTGDMLLWKGHSWEIDKLRTFLAAVDVIARRYLEEVEGVWEQIKVVDGVSDKKKKALERRLDALYKRASRLRSSNGRKSCIEFATTLEEGSLAVDGNLFDSKPWLLACKNGVIDLKSGDFRPGRQDDYITKACPVEYKGLDEPAELWEKFLNEIFDGDQETIDYIQRLFGYGITGLATERIFPVFQGRAQNGKGTIIEVIDYVLGSLVAPIRSEMLLAQPYGKNSAAPAPDIMALKGLRFAVASEVDEKTSFSAAQVKLLTGGDPLSARNPHDKFQTHFKPSHLLILLTNDKPRAPGGDAAFWARMHLVEFPLSFVTEPKEAWERQAIKGLADQLKKEASGILAWLVKGCLMWQRDGLKPTAKIKSATDEYRRDEDVLAGFLEDRCLVDPKAFVSAKDFYEEFHDWFGKNVSKKIPSQKWFGKHMKDKFPRTRPTGRYQYNGVGLIHDPVEGEQG